MTTPSPKQIKDAVEGRLLAVVPGVSEIEVNPSPKGKFDLRFHLADHEHRFKLERSGDTWELSEHRINGAPQAKIVNNAPHARFEHLIAAVIGEKPRPRPSVEVIEVRCPEDERRLFMKLVVQKPLPPVRPAAMIEVSCPQCKRSTGRVTMHIFDPFDGCLIKTEQLQPWVKREPRNWFESSQPKEALA